MPDPDALLARVRDTTSAPPGARGIGTGKRLAAVHDQAVGFGTVDAARVASGSETTVVDAGDVAGAGAAAASLFLVGPRLDRVLGRDNGY